MADSQRKTANLFNASTAMQGKQYNENGVLIDVTSEWYATDYIPVTGGETYIRSINSTGVGSVFNEYNNQKQFIGRYTPTFGTPFTVSEDASYITFSINTTNTALDIYMLNSGSTPLPYEPYWQHSLRRLTTATEAVETPLYSDGTAITSYTIKGNTLQNGTPTPANPIQPSECGDRTGNLFDKTTITTGKWKSTSGDTTVSVGSYSDYIAVDSDTDYYATAIVSQPSFYSGVSYDSAKTPISNIELPRNITSGVIHTPANCAYIILNFSTNKANEVMLNTGSTAKPYEPYGYKIPISSANTTTPVYLGEVQTVRRIKKLVLTGGESFEAANSCFILWLYSMSYPNPKQELIYCTHYQGRTPTYRDSLADGQCMITINQNQIAIKDLTYATVADFKAYLAQQYANGTPVIVYYVLATATTATVNEPLMKIGNYVDTLSNATAIPTTEGANSITVDTTVQPSEFTATWTGWHDASVKEKSENLFDVSTANIGVAWNNSLNNGRATVFISCEPDTDYCFSSQTIGLDLIYICEKVNSSSTTAIDNTGRGYSSPISFTTTSETHCIAVQFNKTNISMQDINNLNSMLNTGSTALPYEPYWK